jgi:nucleolar complex protein 3
MAEFASYEKRPLKRARNEQSQTRLPIKSLNGSFKRNAAFDDVKSQENSKSNEKVSTSDSSSEEQDTNSEETTISAGNISKLSQHELDRRRYRIKLEMGDVCEQILQAPGKAVRQNRTGPCLVEQLLRWCKDPDDEIGRLAIVSGHLVFDDILPSYRIRVASDSEMSSQMKKETRQLREMEKRLLGMYQRYLKCAGSEVSTNLNGPSSSKAAAAVHSLAALLKSRPTFNFRSNIISVLIPLMGAMGTSSRCQVQRTIVREAVEHVFKTDNTGAVSLEIVHVIGKHVKSTNYQMHEDILKCFFRLQLKLDLKDDEKMKQMKKKRKKRNEDDVARGMKEASATVDQQEKNRCQAKILEDIFVTFFRIIRKGGSNSPLLPVSMECIARYSHLINMELVVDLLEALCSLVR